MRILFIRHGKTAGNLEKRYIGRTDEPLCEAGVAELSAKIFPACNRVIASPMVRCIQSAQIVYPGQVPETNDGLRECDFGDFEGKNYTELNGNPTYQAWIDSGGTIPFPNGEDTNAFKARCIAAFEQVVRAASMEGSLAFVVHGGTIMSILERYAESKGDYFDFQVRNAAGYETEWDGAALRIIRMI